MLILTRKLDEKITIGDNITITVCLIDRNKCRIGIEAPKEIPIHRQEVQDDVILHGRKTK